MRATHGRKGRGEGGEGCRARQQRCSHGARSCAHAPGSCLTLSWSCSLPWPTRAAPAPPATTTRRSQKTASFKHMAQTNGSDKRLCKAAMTGRDLQQSSAPADPLADTVSLHAHKICHNLRKSKHIAAGESDLRSQVRTWTRCQSRTKGKTEKTRKDAAYQGQLLHELHIHLLQPVRGNEVHADIHPRVLQHRTSTHQVVK